MQPYPTLPSTYSINRRCYPSVHLKMERRWVKRSVCVVLLLLLWLLIHHPPVYLRQSGNRDGPCSHGAYFLINMSTHTYNRDVTSGMCYRLQESRGQNDSLRGEQSETSWQCLHGNGAWHEGCISAVKLQNGSKRATSALTWILHELSWLQTFSLFYDPSYRLFPDWFSLDVV